MISLLTILTATAFVYAGDPPVSGEIVGGYRILPVESLDKRLHFTVYRGEYIKFDLDQSIPEPMLVIPDLAVEQKLPDSLAEAPYFKMKNSGTFGFTLADAVGTIEVIDYQQPNYTEMTAKAAAEIIANTQPLILDVRTPREFKRGHLKDAVLIPLQELQSRWREIADYQNQDILIYCATGNRSTVASKILIDNGFKRILNLRYGIVDWSRKAFPVVK